MMYKKLCALLLAAVLLFAAVSVSVSAAPQVKAESVYETADPAAEDEQAAINAIDRNNKTAVFIAASAAGVLLAAVVVAVILKKKK